MTADLPESCSIKSRLAVCSWSVQPATPGDLCDACESIGIQRVQLALSPLLRRPNAWVGIFDVLRDRGIEVISGMMEPIGEDYSTLESIARTGGLRPDETWSENREHAAELADLAVAHSISLVTLHAGFLPEERDDPERSRMIRRLQIIADLFGSQRISVALETGQESAETLLEILDAVARPNVGVNFDPANMILYGTGDPIEALRALAPRVMQVHIKDALPPKCPGEWGEEVPVEEGAVDWEAFLDMVLAVDPQVNLVIEREAGEARVRDIRQAQERLVRLASG
jgi:L-ribulose-5-phosphate 3-epimerase